MINMNSKMLTHSLLNSLGVVVYVLGVATIMNNAQRIFGNGPGTVLTGVVFLMLFSVSAAVVGSLVFGYPVVLFLNGQKREAVRALATTIGGMVIETGIVLGVVVILR